MVMELSSRLIASARADVSGVPTPIALAAAETCGAEGRVR